MLARGRGFDRCVQRQDVGFLRNIIDQVKDLVDLSGPGIQGLGTRCDDGHAFADTVDAGNRSLDSLCPISPGNL